ncbi:hypothetical protein AK812_SmicGene3648 [Symbiodinium microadriaticum]|uniref:Uncharacterized protein n=1 Tax=Symbiodinium microadriaticum TaxID=2951 RepID=A0A1Q9EYF1_SYMMI|nr:hypothetical protein AK812_SmicGene3648 [Symbiodinium microadriaticum]
MGFWNVLVSCFATVAGMFSVPLWPARCARSDISFVDVTSIHQVDQELKERGVYGIAGFLIPGILGWIPGRFRLLRKSLGMRPRKRRPRDKSALNLKPAM